jgi:hypothetical protein
VQAVDAHRFSTFAAEPAASAGACAWRSRPLGHSPSNLASGS